MSTLINNEGIVKANKAIEVNGVIEFVSDESIKSSGTATATNGTMNLKAGGDLGVEGHYNAQGGEVVFEAGHDLAVTGPTATEGDTTFKAENDIKVNADVTTDSGNLSFIADSDKDGGGAFLQSPDTTLKTATSGDITIQASGESTLASIESAGDLDLLQAGAPVTYTQYAGSAITTTGSLNIGPNVILQSAVSDPDAMISVGKDWVNQGVFIAGSSTVQLIGPLDATVYGDNTFNNFAAIEPSKKVSFEGGTTQKIVGTLTLEGSYGKLLVLQSTDVSIPWKINPVGATSISYVLVQNSENVNIHGPPLTGSHLQNSSGNTGWDFSNGPIFIGNNSSDWSDGSNWDGGFVPGTFDLVRFTSDSHDSILDSDSTIAGLTLQNTFNGTLTLAADLFVTSDVSLSGGTLNSGSRTITVSGNWSVNGGNLNAETSTVIFNDASRVSNILGNNTFYNFTSQTPAKFIAFEAGKTQTILGTWTIQGAYAEHVHLISTESGVQWMVDPQGLRNIDYAWVEDSFNINPVDIFTTNSTNRGNSIGWDPTITSAATGNWGTGATWVGGVTPGSGDDAVIASGHNVTVNVTNAVALTVTVGSGTNNTTSTLSFNSGSVLTITNSLTVGGSGNRKGTIDMTNGGTLKIGTSVSTNSNTVTGVSGTGTVEYNGAVQTVNTVFFSSYNNLTLSGSGTKTTTGVTVNGILSMEGTATVSAAPTYGSAATLQYNTATSRTAGAEWLATFAATGGVIIANTGTITLNGAKVFSDSVPLTMNSGATLSTSASNFALTLGGNFINSGTFTAGSSAITISGTGAQSIDGFTTTGALTISKTSGTATLNAASGAASLIFSASGATLSISNSLTITGAVTLNNASASDVTAVIAGAGTLSCASVAIGDGSTVSGGGNNNTFTHTLTSTISNFTVSGDLTINSYFATTNKIKNGVFNIGSGTVTVNGSVTTSNANAANTSTLSMATGAQTGTLVLGGATPFTISGTGTSTITLNGTSTTANYSSLLLCASRNRMAAPWVLRIVDG